MKKESIAVHYKTFSSLQELNEQQRMLVSKAEEAMKRAYSPYSKFQVGTALLLDDETIVEGNNQENVAYPSGLCAERVALFYAHAQYPQKKILSIAIRTQNTVEPDENQFVFPCGSCRQVILEMEGSQQQQIHIIVANAKGEGIIVESIHQIMPFGFDIHSLKK
jgi:cytidine deaminase